MTMKSKLNPKDAITLYLNIEQEENAGFAMTLYSPYWIVNHTKLSLMYAEGTYFKFKKTISHAIQSEIDLPDEEIDEEGDDESPEKRRSYRK